MTWKSLLLVMAGMAIGAAALAAGTYLWVWFAMRDAMN
jgi:hypothetical protein